MKIKRLLSIFLCVAMLVSCVVAADYTISASAATEEIASTNASYEDMIAKTADGYGLASTVNEGMILQAWNWSFKSIEENLETVASQGFTTIQVSPPNEIKAGTKGINVIHGDNTQNGWWMFYQPSGFQLNESTDNALGTKSEFIAMCNKAHELGVKIIVDAVINHMGTADNEKSITSTDPMNHLNSRAKEFEPEIVNAKAFHTPWRDCEYHETQQFGVEEVTRSLTRDCTSRLPDLDTSQSIVQTAIYDYLKELIQSGADGFRIDAAKHIETSEDIAQYRSNFWENTLQKVRAEFPENEVFAYGEILNTCGYGRSFSMYTKLMDVTDSASYWGIKDAAVSGGGNAVPFYPNSNFTKANVMLWDESHDGYIDGSMTGLTVSQRNKIWALVAGRSEITSVYFARPDDATNTNPCKSILIGEGRKTAWSNNVTKACNQFSNYFGTQGEYCNQSGGKAWIERGDAGCMIVNLGGTTSGSVSLTTHILKSGTYKDAITGNTFKVSGNRLTGSVGSTGVACVYYSTEQSPTGDEPTIVVPTIPGGNDVPTQPGHYTVIFSNSKGWTGDIFLYWWATGGEGPVAWPGTAMSFYQQNEYGENQYIGFVPTEYDNLIVTNGTAQTDDAQISDHMGIYADAATTENHFTLGTWSLGISINTPTQAPTSAPTIPPTTVVPTETQAPTVSGGYAIGDADNDGDINIIDATFIQSYLASLETMNASQTTSADADGDGSVTIMDATAIQLYLAKVITTLG